MKNAIIVLLAAVSLTLGTLCLRQNRKAAEIQHTTAELQQNVSELQDQLAEKETVVSNLKTRVQDTPSKIATRAEPATPLDQTATNKAQVEAKAKAENPMAEMFKNPEMKEMIKTQQKTFLNGFIDKNYAPFFAAMQLNPEQSATLKDLIVKKAMVGAQAGMSMMAGETDEAKRAEAFQQIKSDTQSANDELKQFLGEDNFAQFEAYEKTQPERMAVSTFKDQQGSGAGALSPDQESQLIQAMTEEKQGFKFTTDFTDQSKFDGDFATYFTEEKINQFQQEFEQLNQKYLPRAQAILSADQFEQFKKFLTAQAEMQKLGFKMAAKMFGPHNAN